MSAVLDFEHLHVDSLDTKHLFQHLREIYDSWTIDCILSALKLNAFIAGGWSRCVVNALENRSSHALLSEIKRYVHASHGDIDVFFRTEQELNAFLSESNQPWIHTKNAVCLPGNSLQAITCIVGAPEEIMESFDISNACVAITKSSIMRPHGYDELEAMRQLHVQRWGDRTVYRVRKWFKKHDDLELLHPACNDEYIRRSSCEAQKSWSSAYEMLMGVMQ